MTEQPTNPEHEDDLSTVMKALLTAFENLGAEHQALTEEEKETTATERRGTVRRMLQSITDAGRILAHSVDLVATVYGLRELGVDRQMAKGADGSDYSPLLTVGGSEEKLYETAAYLEAAAQRLVEAYKQTKKYPALAKARRPQEVRTVLSSLRGALTGLCAEMAARGLTEGRAECEPWIAKLCELEAQTCTAVPAQASELTAGEVTAAILANPAIAEAAAAALERTTA
ncbi:hypothetical protein OG582_39860 (plasmid) [Streptomyces anulatus]|uniref:hypothetical protein n=1 Tax=Streptomyces anulatus TaxID=1892 RepID=UPI002F908802